MMFQSLIKTSFILSLCIFSACKDKASDPEILFKNLSLTDENGQALSSPDPDDWRTNDAWFPKETALFAGIPELPICTEDADVEVYDAYPNPARNYFHLTFRCRAGTQLELRLVNQDFEVLRSFSLPGFAAGSNTVSIQVDDLPGINGQTLRLYYKLLDGNCEFRGHGDILVQ